MGEVRTSITMSRRTLLGCIQQMLASESCGSSEGYIDYRVAPQIVLCHQRKLCHGTMNERCTDQENAVRFKRGNKELNYALECIPSFCVLA